MGFMDKINELKEGAMKQYGRLANKTLMEGTMAALAMVTNANGEVKAEEMAMVIGLIGRDDDLAVYDMTEMTAVFTKRMEGFKLSSVMGEAECLAEIGKLKKKANEATLLIGKCCAIAGADGDFDENEKGAVRKMCAALDLNPVQFDL